MSFKIEKNCGTAMSNFLYGNECCAVQNKTNLHRMLKNIIRFSNLKTTKKKRHLKFCKHKERWLA